MTVHGVVLFLHVLLAIGLVGGSVWSDVGSGRLRRATTVSEARAHAQGMRVFVKASMPLAAGTFLAGAYLATVGSMWTEPWLLASLLLFVAAGAVAGNVIDPAIGAVVEALEAAPDGPVPADVDRLRHAPGASTVASLMAGADLALVFLMTNKPGLVGSVLATVVGLMVGAGLAARERRHRVAPALGA